MCSTIRPPKRAHYLRVFEPSIFVIPRLVAFTRTCLWSNESYSIGSKMQALQVCSTICPKKRAHCFKCFLNQAFLWCPNQYLLPELVSGRIGHSGSEIQALQVCSTILPEKRVHWFKFFGTKHICNAPTCSLHRNLFLVQLVTVAQRSKPSKCARLSAPKKGPND